MNKITLHSLDKHLKYLLSSFLLVLGMGIFTGLIYINHTTGMDSKGTIERYNGSEAAEYEIPESFPKEFESMILMTHEHIIAFSIISILIGLIFSFNSLIKGKLKCFFMLEPFISIIITFGSMWLMRYYHEAFVYALIPSSMLLYFCWYFMIIISIYELNFKKTD